MVCRNIKCLKVLYFAGWGGGADCMYRRRSGNYRIMKLHAGATVLQHTASQQHQETARLSNGVHAYQRGGKGRRDKDKTHFPKCP